MNAQPESIILTGRSATVIRNDYSAKTEMTPFRSVLARNECS